MTDTFEKVDNNRLPAYLVKVTKDADGYDIQHVSSSQGVVPIEYDEMDITYVAAGNGEGEIYQVIYKKNSEVIITITNTYNADNKLSNVTWA
jgi:hypothetical protein